MTEDVHLNPCRSLAGSAKLAVVHLNVNGLISKVNLNEIDLVDFVVIAITEQMNPNISKEE